MSDWSLSVVSGGSEVDLTDNINYVLQGLDGIGMAPTLRIQQQGPQQHGASDIGFRLQPRILTLGLLVKGGSAADWLTARNTLLSLFRATDTLPSLKIIAGTFVRQIDCAFSTAMDSSSMSMPIDPDTRTAWQPVAISLIAPDPTWYDPVGTSITYGLGGGGDSMEIPLAIPWTVGAASIDASKVVTYDGTWDAFPIITIKGPIDDCVIENTSLDVKLDFTGLNLAAGSTRVVDCRYGQKTVVDESGTNKVADLSSDSDLATFRIGAHPSPLDGNNSISVSGTNITAATEIFLQYNTRFVGV